MNNIDFKVRSLGLIDDYLVSKEKDKRLVVRKKKGIHYIDYVKVGCIRRFFASRFGIGNSALPKVVEQISNDKWLIDKMSKKTRVTLLNRLKEKNKKYSSHRWFLNIFNLKTKRGQLDQEIDLTLQPLELSRSSRQGKSIDSIDHFLSEAETVAARKQKKRLVVKQKMWGAQLEYQEVGRCRRLLGRLGIGASSLEKLNHVLHTNKELIRELTEKQKIELFNKLEQKNKKYADHHLFINFFKSKPKKARLLADLNKNLEALQHPQSNDSPDQVAIVDDVSKLSNPQDTSYKLDYQRLIDRSDDFHKNMSSFPLQSHRIQTVVGDDESRKKEVVEFAKTTRLILPAELKTMIQNFLDLKCTKGTGIEKAFYTSMDVDKMIARLLSKRPVAFYGKDDNYLLRKEYADQQVQGKDTYYIPTQRKFRKIATVSEEAPFRLEDYLSYDERFFSALIGVSSFTYFINSGNKENLGEPDSTQNFQQKGVYIGLTGPCFEKNNEMESTHLLVQRGLNRPCQLYGARSLDPLLKLWASFYAEGKDDNHYFATFSEAEQDKSGKYLLLSDECYLNTHAYKKRLEWVIKPFLLEANQRAQTEEKKGYVLLTPLGLGTWANHEEKQRELFVQAVAEMIETQQLPAIAHIDFNQCNALDPDRQKEITQKLKKKGIESSFSSDDIAKKLPEEYLLIASYEANGNSLPGNEYWKGQFNQTAGAAAACCSLISELHNPYINDHLLGSRPA